MCRTAKAQWAARQSHTSVVDAAGAIYVIGGEFGYGNGFTDFNDVWASADGGARPDSVGGGRRELEGDTPGGTRGGTQGY
jgi:hypothetical protein